MSRHLSTFNAFTLKGSFMACVKVYLCSNPEDCVMERRSLRENMFPRLRDFCRSSCGVDFRVIDPYEAADPADWPSQRRRLQMLADCRTTSLGPYFVALVGEQYGEACLPEQIEASEFQCLLQTCQRMKLSTDVLQRCYQRDESVIPPSFCSVLSPAARMKPPAEHSKNLRKEKSWSEVRRIFQDVVAQCVQEGTITRDKAQKYFWSALEYDIRYAYEDQTDRDKVRCLCYVHKIKVRGKADGNDPDQSDRLSQLRDHFLPSLVTSHKARVYSTTTVCTLQEGYTAEMRLNFAAALGEQLQLDLKRLIDCSFSEKRAVTDCEVGQKDLCHVFSSLYSIERSEVKHVKSYLQEQNTTSPFVVTGKPSSGKTVLLAHCASQASEWFRDVDPVIILHFIDNNSSLRQLLKDSIQQMDSSYQHVYTCVNDIPQLKETFNRLLNTSSHLLLLIIDGLDQLPAADELLDLTWLPKSLPPNVKVLISMNANRPDVMSAIKSYCQDSPLFCELQPVEGKSCIRLLTTLLQASNRKITSGQQLYVNQALKKCPLPLYVKLLYKQANLWSSDSEVTENSLVQGVHNNIVLMLEHLEGKHGKTIVSRALSYLTLSRYGMTAAELTDVLSCDDEVLASFLLPHDLVPLTLRVPEVLVEDLLFDLKEFLVLRNVLGTKTLFWISRHFPLVICKRYLCSEDACQKIHHVLSNYFSGNWANGKAKHFIFKEDSEIANSSVPQNIYIERQVPSQPWIFSPSSHMSTARSSSERTHVNLRKLLELPFHLLKSGQTEKLGEEMTSQEYLQAMLQARLFDDLFLWLEKTSQIKTHRKLRLLNIILRSSACLLKDNQAELPAVLQARLLPFLKILPTLKKCVNPAKSDGVTVRNGVCTVLPSVPSIPYTHCTLQESKPVQIVHAAGSPDGTLVVVLENGTAWVCNEGIFEIVKLPKTSNLQFTSVRSSGNIFLLGTRCSKLVLWNTNVNTQPQEIRIQDREKGKNIPKGVLVFNDKIFVWWEERNYVSVFVEVEEYFQLKCVHEITCVSCSEDSNVICCGQKESSVTVFDCSDGQFLATFTCPEEIPVIDMILCEDERTITCVDEAANVFAWNIEIITEPVLIKQNYCRTKGKVLKTDYKGDNILLICKKNQIDLLDIDQMDVLDQFKPPEGKTVKQAVLDQDSHFIIALLSDCPFLLVWNCITGQCVCNLDTVNCQAIELVKCGETHLAAVTHSSVFIWDMDLITASALAPKSGKKIEIIVVGLHGESCYSADGSKLVWKWVVSSGKVEEHFLHHGPVKFMSISANGDYLVTIAMGDIYVWDTNNGENIQRISGSCAFKVLITPKGNSGVALSEKGPSRVWKLQRGNVVCSVHVDLRNAIISPESTFLLGINRRDLLAVSLWSGNVCKCFSCPDQSDIVAFHFLLDCPDFTVVVSALGALYSWRLTDDTICHQFQLPNSFCCQPEIFSLSSDGAYAMLSITTSTLNILDLSNSKLCSLKTEGPVHQPPYVSFSSQYVVYACYSTVECQNASCDLHEKPVLVVIRTSDGETVGRFYLCKSISALTVSEHFCVYVGFEDGSVGVYAFNDSEMGNSSWKGIGQNPELLCPLDEPLVRLPLVNPNLTWVELVSEMS